jgi:L-fucose isomerase-like protein|tara:strand:- start:3 stop:413 length:411 start_codon:yes stop_codon:yes gene_type:complete
MKLNNVDKAMSNGGPDTKKIDMSEFIRLADKEKIQSDLENEIIQLLNEKFREQRKPGESIKDFIRRIPKEELLKLELSGGGKVISIQDFLKQREEPKIKKIDLAQGDFEKTVAGLTKEDKLLIRDLLKMSGIKVSD